ncbi:MAG: FtsH protease activity modulator HflK [Pseudomonadota bacterium]
MAWNEPGGDKDPWSGRGGDQGPPDLDEAFKKLQSQLTGIFGGGGGSRSGSSGPSAGMFAGLLVLALIVYAVGGFYMVDESERAVEFRFGKVKEEVSPPGLHWYPLFIDSVEIVNVAQVREHPHKALMLTEDENIVDVSLTVQWIINNAIDYVVKVKEPMISLDHATESALRHVVGSSEMDYVITEGRAAIGAEVQQRLQSYLDLYNTGIQVSSIQIKETGPPQQVKEAFDDVQKAKEDEARLINEADAYAEKVIPEARGQAQRQLEQANAYRDEVVARSEGEADRFTKLWREYSSAKKVTRDRLYIDAVESVLARSNKVMVDVEGGNNMLYLPLDRMGSRGPSGDLGQSQIRRMVEDEVRDLARNSPSIRRTNPR